MSVDTEKMRKGRKKFFLSQKSEHLGEIKQVTMPAKSTNPFTITLEPKHSGIYFVELLTEIKWAGACEGKMNILQGESEIASNTWSALAATDDFKTIAGAAMIDTTDGNEITIQHWFSNIGNVLAMKETYITLKEI